MKVLTLLVARLLVITLPACLAGCAMRGSEPIEVLMTYYDTRDGVIDGKVTKERSDYRPKLIIPD